MNSLFQVLKVCFAIIGTVIGAGFISGMEILTFFNDSNIIISVIILFFLFSFCFTFFLSIKKLPNNVIVSIFEPLILFGNVIIMSGMASAINEVMSQTFSVSQKLQIFSILSLVLSLFMMLKGINGLMSFNLIFVPLMICLTVVMIVDTSNVSLSYSGKINFPMILLYQGVNTFLSVPVFVSLGQKISFKQSLIASVVASIVLCFLVFLIYVCLHDGITNLSKSPIPTYFHVSKKPKYLKLFSIVFLIGSFTTMLSSNFPLSEFSNTFRKKKLANVISVCIVFLISLLGFYRIVNYIYPIIGFCGVGYTIICLILSIMEYKRKNRQ